MPISKANTSIRQFVNIGVEMVLLPYALTSPYPKSSARITITFGLLVFSVFSVEEHAVELMAKGAKTELNNK